jgi:hypothetical protein
MLSLHLSSIKKIFISNAAGDELKHLARFTGVKGQKSQIVVFS